MSAHAAGRLLARNTALNAVGQVLPLLVALPVLPYVLHTLGAERFAVLSLAWTLIGYFGFLDLGLGRAATKYVAAAVAAGRREEVERIVWSSALIQLPLGALGAALIVVLAPIIVHGVLRIDDASLVLETTQTITAIAAGLPLVLLSGTMSGVLEAHQRFDLVNAVRVPGNIATLALPAAGAAAGMSLPAIVVLLVLARAAVLLCFGALAFRIAGRLRPRTPDRTLVRRLVGFGGWLSVSLLAVPVFTYAERFLLGGLRSLTELAYYAVPFEIVARMAVVPAAVAFTLFPAFSSAQSNPALIAGLFRKPLRMLFLVQWPLLVVCWLFPHEMLGLWLGPEVAAAGAQALRLLALAFFFNGFAHVALAGVQGLGRPDLKAKLDLVELPIYGLTAWLLIARFGITGAAAAKLIISLIDTAMLFVFAQRLGAPALFARDRPVGVSRRTAIATACVIATLAATPAALPLRIAAAAATIVLLSALFWTRVLDASDRAALLGIFTSRPLKAPS